MNDFDHAINISSSDSDIDFEVGAIESDDDDASSTNARAKVYMAHGGYRRSDPDFQSSASQRKCPSSEYQKLSVKHIEKKDFPPSFHPSVSNTKPNDLRGSERMCQSNGSRSLYPFDRPSSVNGNNHEKHSFGNAFMRAMLPKSEYQEHSVKHFTKQAFPPSFHSSVSYSKESKPNILRDGENMAQFNGSGNSYPFDRPSLTSGKNHENRTFGNDFMRARGGERKHQNNGSGNSYPFDRPSSTNGKNHENHTFGNDFTRARGGERMHQNNGSGNSYPFDRPNSVNGKNPEKHTFGNEFKRAAPSSSGHNASSADPMEQYGDEKLGETDERSVFEEVIQDLNQPKQEAELPEGLMTVPLLRHQKISLAWMLQKEARAFCVGGILADDQGLGKTISTIALIQMERHSNQKPKSKNCKIEALALDDDDDKGFINLDGVEPTKDYNSVESQHSRQKVKSEDFKPEPVNLDDYDDDKGIIDLDDVRWAEDFSSVKFIPKRKSSQQSASMQRPSAGTLVVCPASVLRQWHRELRTKVTEEAKLSVLIYHGSKRTKDPSKLAKYDVVLTTYAIVSNEVPKPPLPGEEDSVDNQELSAESSRGAKRKRKQSKFPKKGKKGRKGLADSLFDTNCGTLAKVNWLRVVLDEAQIIKNHKTKAARACCGLRAKKRWCLSGTPLQNAIEDLFSYFRFLKYDPYSSYKVFLDRIKSPISINSTAGYNKLQVVLRTVMLRRTKGTKIDGQPILNLPPKIINMESLDLTFEERDFYAKLEYDSRVQFKAYDMAGTVGANYANILVLLLRLRQACDHPYLCVCGPESVKETDSIPTLKKLPKDRVASLLDCLQGSVICQCCEDIPEAAIVTICGHVFCDQCILDRLACDENTCPVKNCKEELNTGVIFSKATLRSCLLIGSESIPSNGDDPCDGSRSVTSREYTSSKIRAALGILRSLFQASVSCVDLEDDKALVIKSEPCIDLEDDNLLMIKSGPCIDLENDNAHMIKSEPCIDLEDDNDPMLKSDPTVRVRTEIINPSSTEGPKKVIIFSQWTRMLNLMQASLLQYGIIYRRLDGTMNLFARDKAVREFNTKPEVAVMLMSLKAGNLGLNMVAACHIILLDLWWNPTTEDQAIDRAHRIGQTRAVTVSRLTVKDSVEDRILALQEMKRKMVASAYGEENAGGSSRLSIQDLRFLFMGA